MKKTVAVTVAVLLVLTVSVSARAEDRDHAAKGIEGTWLSVVVGQLPDGTPMPFIQFLNTFNADGRTTIALPFGPDAMIPSGPSEPTANLGDSRIACTGEWRYAGKRTYDVTMYCLWRQNPGVTPDRIRYRLTLDKSGKHLAGPFKYLYNDPVIPPENAGLEIDLSLVSTRLGLVPLD